MLPILDGPAPATIFAPPAGSAPTPVVVATIIEGIRVLGAPDISPVAPLKCGLGGCSKQARHDGR